MQRKENLDKFNELLTEWDGSEALLEKQRPGDEHFTIGLFKKGCSLTSGEGVVGITLLYCGYISGPTRWCNCKLRCRKQIFQNKYWEPKENIEGYELFDEEAGFSIHCYDNLRFGDGELYVLEPT
ncbi:MAG: hypothetical protein AB2826_27630 [Candidatus Thiodiazotropha sp.]